MCHHQKLVSRSVALGALLAVALVFVGAIFLTLYICHRKRRCPLNRPEAASPVVHFTYHPEASPVVHLGVSSLGMGEVVGIEDPRET